MYFTGSWLAVVEVWRWDPFGVAVVAFSGGPAAGFDQWVIGAAGQGQRVDVGAVGGGPLLDMVHFAVVAGRVAAWARAAAVLGVQDNSLARRRQSFGVIQRDGFGVVENRQIVVGMAG